MKTNGLALLVFPLALLFAGCPSVPEQTNSSASNNTSGESLSHRPSGIQFPLVVGEFKRTSFRQYDAEGLDVSAGYDANTATGPLALTMYVYPSPPINSFGSPSTVVRDAKHTLARQEFERRTMEVQRVHPDAVLVSSKELDPTVTRGGTGSFSAKFTLVESFHGQVRQLESVLYITCYVGDKWTVKFRVTYPATVDAQPAIDSFLGEISRQ